MLRLVPLYLFSNVLVIGNQAWLNMMPKSLLKLLFLKCISTASFMRQPKYLGGLSLCSDVHISGVPCTSPQQPTLRPIYTFPHSHRISSLNHLSIFSKNLLTLLCPSLLTHWQIFKVASVLREFGGKNNWAILWSEHATCKQIKKISLIVRENSVWLGNKKVKITGLYFGMSTLPASR